MCFQSVACKLYVSQIFFAYFNATCHILIMAVDRVFAIHFPFKYRLLNFPKIAAISSFGVTLSACMLSIPNFFWVTKSSETNVCVAADYIQISKVFRILFLVALPVLIMVVCNVIFVKALIKRRREGSSGRNQRLAERIQNEQNYIRLLMLTTAAFLILLLTSNVLANEGVQLRKSAASFLLGDLLVALSRVVFTLNYTLNFCFYYSSGPMFRSAFSKMFLVTSRRSQNANMASSSISGGANEVMEMRETSTQAPNS